jgi:hypothetical protein
VNIPIFHSCDNFCLMRGNPEFLFFWVITMTRNEKNQLLLGIRRAIRPQTVMPSSVLSSDSMHIGLLAAAAHAAATNSCFTVFYNPRWLTVLKVSLSLSFFFCWSFPL